MLFCFVASLSVPLSLHLSVLPALAAEGGMVMFNAWGLCCTQHWRMGSSPLISNKRSLETRQAQHRSSSSKVWSDVDTDVCPGPSTVCSWASHRILTEPQRPQHWAYSSLNYLSRGQYWYLCMLLVDCLRRKGHNDYLSHILRNCKRVCEYE